MSKQPEALELAAILEIFSATQRNPNNAAHQAAAELRRQHELIGKLVDKLGSVCSAIGSLNSGRANAIQVNGETVYWQREEWVRWMLDEIVPDARAAIAAAPEAAPAEAGS